MASWKWEFYDPIEDETYVFEINPNEGASPEYHKSISKKTTTAPDGQTVIMEGQDEPKMMSCQGSLLSQAQYDALVTWFEKRRVIRLTDDFERQFNVYIEAFSPKRKRSVQYPWRHDYDLSLIVLEQVV